ncbi:hypothetical protein Tco_0569840 [Tanacetum coccineum]
MKMILTKKVYKLPTCLLQWYGWSDGLIRWFINGQNRYLLVANVPKEQVRFAVSTLTKEALFWWNSFTQSIGIEEAYKITWSEFKRLLIEKYCPQTKIRKMEEAITMTHKLIKHVVPKCPWLGLTFCKSFMESSFFKHRACSGIPGKFKEFRNLMLYTCCWSRVSVDALH